MLNVELPNGLKGASLIQHSTFYIKKLKVLSDIRTEVLVGELDLLCLSKALLQGFFLVLAVAAYADDTTTVGYYLTILHGCTGVEYY